jgi:hypothetical protein
MSNTTIIHNIPPVDHATATGKQKEVLDLALKQVGFIPNMYVRIPANVTTHSGERDRCA